MLGKPIISINKFSGSGNGGVFFNEGFIPDKDNGASILREGLVTSKDFDSSDTGFKTPTAITNVQAINYVLGLDNTNVYKLIIDDSGQFFIRNLSGSSFKDGYIGVTPTTGNFKPSKKPDLYQMISGNILFTNNIAIGLIIRGKVKTGSSTTTIIDTAGRNFTTMGVTTDNVVANLKTGAVYAITSITDGDATKDKLSFTASGVLTNSANDEFAIIVHQKFDLTSGITIPAFVGQPDYIYWSRQIKQFGDEYFALNGNYIAKLAADETTFAANWKLLPAGFQATCFDTNTDRMLIAVRSISQGFRLLLWDGYSDGFNNILEVEDEINCIKNYKNGWVFIINSTLYFTDGYQIQELQSYSGKSLLTFESIQPRNFNGIEIVNESIVTYSNSQDYSRVMPGVYVWNRNYGWSYIPVIFNSRLYGTPTGIFLSNYANSSASYFPPGIDIGLNGGVDTLSDNSTYSSQYLNRSFIYFIKLPYRAQIKQISLNIGTDNNRTGDVHLRTQTKLSVNIGEGKGNILSYNQITSVPSTTTISADGDFRTGTVGDEIQFVDSILAGERTFITSIADKGTNSEVWTVSPALSSSLGSPANIRVIRVKNTNPVSKTVNIDNFDKPILFNVDKGFISDKLYIEIIITGVTTPCPISINSIDIM